MSGTGSTIAEGTLQLGAADTSSHNEVLSQRSFSNTGNANWLGNAGEFDQQNGSTFTNQANASFTIQNNLDWYNDENNSTFVNLGTFTKSAGTGTTIFEVGFNNNGSVEVQTGTLSLRGGGTSSGSFTADASATLGFDASYTNTPPFVLSATSTISGAGTAEFGSGTVNDTGTLNMAGGITVDGRHGQLYQSGYKCRCRPCHQRRHAELQLRRPAHQHRHPQPVGRHPGR